MDLKNYNIADVATLLLHSSNLKKNEINHKKKPKHFAFLTFALSVFFGIFLTGNVSAQVAELYSSGNTTICQGESTTIAVHITASVGPYTVVYSDGADNFTVSNYASDEFSDDDITV